MEQGTDFALKKDDLDAILFPSYIGSTICAKAGYPSIAVPAGFMKRGGPFRVTIASTAFSEGLLIKLAYAFEQAPFTDESLIYKQHQMEETLTKGNVYEKRRLS